MIKPAPDLLAIASALLPGERLDDAFVAADGNIHDVLLIPGVAAVRVSRRPLVGGRHRACSVHDKIVTSPATWLICTH